MRSDVRNWIDQYLRRLEVEHPYYDYGYDEGRRYAKLWKRSRGSSSRSIVAFVDADDGGLYKADSWSKRGRFINHIGSMLHSSSRDVSRAKLSAKIRRLHGEGYRGKQAVAIAYSMLSEKRKKRRRKRR